MKKCLFLLSAITMLIVHQSCSKTDVDDLIGTWGKSIMGVYFTVSFTDGGTFTVSAAGDTDSGTFSTSDDEITFYDSGCTDPGKYKFEVKKKTLTFTTIADNCSDRALIIAGEWEKK
jgi:hypothetical protein